MYFRCLCAVFAGLAIAGTAHAQASAPTPLRIVTDNNFPPYVFVDDSGKVVGYEVDLWKLWQEKTGRKIDFQAMDWATAQQRMLDGKADVIDLMYETPEREKTYSFSHPDGVRQVSIFARDAITGLDSIQALKGFVVGAERGDACVSHLHADGITTLKLYDNYQQIITAAANREFPAFCMDDDPAHYYLYKRKDHAQFKKAFSYYQGQLHWAVLKGNESTLAMVNRGMRMITSQERARLRKKWMGSSIYFTYYTHIFAIALAIMIGLALVALAALRTLRQAVARKTAELLHKNAQLTALIESSPDLIWMKDTDGTYLACNQATANFLGRPSDKVIGRKDRDLMDPALAEDIRRRDIQTIHSGQRTTEEVQALNPLTNAQRVIETIKAPIVDAHGVKVGIVAVGRDITGRKVAEARLEQAAMLFHSTSDCILVTDLDRRIVTVNAAFIQTTGYDADEVRGKQPLFLDAQHGADTEFSSFWSPDSSGDIWQGEAWCRRKDGEIFPAWWNINPSRNARGEVTHLVAVFSDTGQLKRYQSQIEYLTFHDLLTKLPNRSLLMDRLEQAISRASYKRRKAALMMMGLDHFRRINESLGHDVGDALLKEIGQRILKVAPLGKTIARMGGDEFALVLVDITDTIGMTALAERLLDAIARPFEFDGKLVQPRASIGIAVYPRDAQDVGSLVKNAAAAMHQAKSQSPLKVHFYDEELSATAIMLHELETDLVHALERSQFELYFQPQWQSGTDTITGIEALVRWNRPGSGVVSPTHFLPLAEEMGIVAPIGQWILRAACAQCARWQAQRLPEVPIAVNITVAQLVSDTFVAEVQSALEANALRPGWLELEITEGQLVQKGSHAEKVLADLRGLGVRIAIDDFGTGYSSLAYLRRLPADVLKIDKSFIDDIPEQQDAVRIVAAIISMAHTLNMKVVAEGVETESQVNTLHALECDYLQGYYKTRPLPADAVAEFCWPNPSEVK
jgi:diguanylate cyclase (GGDEF)-like protein/PAS domain S-box-containing protein